MSDVGQEGRSYEKVTAADLERLASLEEADRDKFFERYPKWAALYQERFIGAALCQGAALHMLCADVGVQDFDVYTFYARNPAKAWYAKRLQPMDFGDPKFGTSLDSPNYIGRRVDLMSRALPVEPGHDIAFAIQEWLESGRPNSTPAFLGDKAVVLLAPRSRLGEVVWPKHCKI
ncbi:MAG: hypothetical protein O2913_11915 [Chloroflexi bacterium]|nr:hypothetical protein [Chloroflexota bacterium]